MSGPVVAIRALEHFAYCRRQAAIIHVDGVWRDNAHTVRGVRRHRRVDSAPSRVERQRVVVRGLDLWSERHGLKGRADAVELNPDGTVEPVEYKSGRRHGDAAELQLCAQALCLEEMFGITIRRGAVWYGGPRRRVGVEMTPSLRDRTIRSIDALRAMFDATALPPPPNDARCTECQLLGYCQPSLVANPDRIRAYVRDEVLSCG